VKVLDEAEPGNPAAGACWLDPRDLPALLALCKSRLTSERKGVAGVVIAGNGRLLASTIPCDDHMGMASRAGIELDEPSPFDGPRVADMRGFATAECVTVEFWRPEEGHPDAALGDYEQPAVAVPLLEEVARAVRAHPGIRRAYPRGVPEVAVSLMCNWRPEWLWSDATGRLALAGDPGSAAPGDWNAVP
jgi:hypothetical protein